MDFLLELLFGIFVEVPLEAAMESRHVKPWVKTTLVLLVGLGLSALFAVLAIDLWISRQDIPPAVGAALIAAAWTVFVLIFAVRGHRRKWKK